MSTALYPEIILKLAVSADGYMDDHNAERLILSGEEDLQAVDLLRSEVDGIMVGANTVRKDNPGLLIKSQELINARIDAGKSPQPLRIILSESGNLPTDARIFSGEHPTLICSNNFPASTIDGVSIAPLNGGLDELLRHLKSTGVNRLLVEGGAHLLNQLLDAGLFDQLRLATSPIAIGKQHHSAPRFNVTRLFSLNNFKTEQYGKISVTWFQKKI